MDALDMYVIPHLYSHTVSCEGLLEGFFLSLLVEILVIKKTKYYKNLCEFRMKIPTASKSVSLFQEFQDPRSETYTAFFCYLLIAS